MDGFAGIPPQNRAVISEKNQQDNCTLHPDAILTLKQAVELPFMRGFAVSTLRKAIIRGDLECEMHGNTYFVTVNYLKAWRRDCRNSVRSRLSWDTQVGESPISTSERALKNRTARPVRRTGSSATSQNRSAQAALVTKLNKLSNA